MTESGARDTTQGLGPWLWSFVGLKLLGIIWNVLFILFVLLWAVPRVAHTAGREHAADVTTEVLLPAAESCATVVGFVFIFRRSRRMRAFWIGYLVLYCVLRTWELLFSEEAGAALFFLVTGAGWLAYWIWAQRPRELQLASHWTAVRR